MSTFVLCVGCGAPLYGFSPCQWCTCELCGNDLRDEFCSLCNSRNSCVYDPNPNSFDCPPDSCHPPHPTYETYWDDSCGNNSHFGHDCLPRKFNRYSFFKTPKVLLLAWDRVFEIKDAFGNKQYKAEDIQELFRELFNDVQNIHEELAEYINTPGWNCPAFYNNGDDDDEDYSIAITPEFLITDSLIIGDEHLDTIPEKESDEFIKSSVEDLVPNPSEFEDECECDVPNSDDSKTTNFSTFSNPFFDDSTSSDDESSHEEVIHEMSFKTYSNPLFDLDEEIISSEFNPIYNKDLDSTPKNDRFDTEPYLLESLLNCDTLIASSLKIDSLLAEFAGELIFLISIPPGIDEANCDPEEDIRLIERFLYDNSSPRPLEEFVFENYNAEIESFSPSPIRIEDSDSPMEEIDLSFTPNDPVPPGIEEDDDDSERDILILEELLENYSLSLPENESFRFDIPWFSRTPAKPPDGDTRILNIKMIGDISEQKVPMPRLTITSVSNQEKSPDLISHQGLEIF
nr:pre-mRNA splicing Prp18-interacting factor [Tanacetum cinerariifolium]